MPVICQLCHQEFEKIISSTHLKFSHQTTSVDYKLQFGPQSLASPEYRAQRSLERSGANNPMFGRSQTDEAKSKVSQLNRGKIPHNKGSKVTDPKLLKRLQEGIDNREAKYKLSGYHPRRGAAVSTQTRNKISNSVRDYADKYPVQMQTRAKLAVNTKQQNGYFEKKRADTVARHQKKWNDFEYDLREVDHNQVQITHRSCGNSFLRNIKSEFNSALCSHCYPNTSTSVGELELRDWLKNNFDIEFIWQDRSQLKNGFELDVWIPEKRIAIEYNGLYWHSVAAGRSRWYHRTKLDRCREQGIRLIQIFEDEWQSRPEIVKRRLLHIIGSRAESGVAARKCQIQEISVKTAKDFAQQYHIQGAGVGTICYGLYYQDQLLAVMDFSKLNRAKGQSNRPGWYELSRYCSIGRVIGGASRLFKRFVKDHDPTTVISYSDKRWNTGELYSKLGFGFQGATVPNYWYVKGVQRFYRYQFRKDRLVAQGADPSQTEGEIMKSQGYNVIWDCGSDKWVWNRKAEQ